LPDIEQEAQASALMETLRCLTCQSQSIADSDAPVAGDMRHQVRTRIAGGETPQQIRAWMVERYGDYVTYEPRLGGNTWPLFVLPGLFVLAGGFVLWRRVKRKRISGGRT
jgi:cytochrome c-type biogenesis protein CcmH